MKNAEEVTKPEQFLADLMVLLGSDEMEWEAVQDHAVKLLKDWREQYASLREKETARQAWNMATVQTLVEHCDNTTPTGNFEKLDFDEWYTKHKEG